MAHFINKYLGNLRTEAQHLKSGQKIITDAPIDNKGKGEAFSPTDLVCVALSSCMLTTIGIVANRENIDLTGLTTEINKTMSSNPRKIAEIEIVLAFSNGEKLTESQKELLKRTALSCPVALSLNPEIQQKVSFSFG